MKNGLQKFGKFLSAMVMPNIGAFIAWGFITALFIADGWIPNEKLASIQPYMLTFLFPLQNYRSSLPSQLPCFDNCIFH